ncbi:TetR/AcrR family transcriptional regulator [Shewanella youngdeokensis]|uniref:TetR/AcrR family transcriptional regulator n=1 Tax=Shewanella youngdeokensis TaxID=2999068 RepID=A0ABZ0K0X9_9GAMM|nr:TetR/AcrR family transcriptional regulator [Shewanella sp. DAU334]
MSTERDLSPKQQRSQQTQHKLLVALHSCLADKFFEHISIKDIATKAGVSVGTFYRRFKNKESLLPLLYQDFGRNLVLWIDDVETNEYIDLRDAITQLTAATYQLILNKKSVFRTLHLNSRLHSNLLSSDKSVNREVVYQRLSTVLLRFEKEIIASDKKTACDMVIYMMINTLLDKALYPNLTPATASQLTAAEFSSELPQVLLAYLTKNS